MAERKAVNKWYPSDFDPKKHGSANGYQGSHHLRERARKLDQGILIVRFEMPFNIWCDGCKNHIGMGVRYNAEKSKVGSYYSTIIWQFKMKCHLCENRFEIRTDPANLDYLVVSGARRQDKRWDPSTNEQIVAEDKETTQQLNTNAMFKLEHMVNDKSKLNKLVPTLERLEDFQYQRWQDDYAANCALRSSFRAFKKQCVADESKDKQIASKCGIDIEMVKESDEDKRLAHLLTYANSESSGTLKNGKQNDVDFESISALNSTLSDYVDKNIQNNRLKAMAKNLAVKQSKSIDRKSINSKLSQTIKKSSKKNKINPMSSNVSTLVANYSSDDQDE